MFPKQPGVKHRAVFLDCPTVPARPTPFPRPVDALNSDLSSANQFRGPTLVVPCSHCFRPLITRLPLTCPPLQNSPRSAPTSPESPSTIWQHASARQPLSTTPQKSSSGSKTCAPSM